MNDDWIVRRTAFDLENFCYGFFIQRVRREADEAAVLREARSRLQPGDMVDVPRFGKQGKVIRVDHKRNVVMVSVGLGQWEVSLDEVFPPPA